jgi:signal transduction histidine kinase
MRLADFISAYPDTILTAWDAFAKSNEPAALSMDAGALRNHAAQMLAAIAADMGTSQTRAQQVDKSEARAPADDDSAASIHGAARLISGFTMVQLVAEYRALRSSVLRLWADHGKMGASTDLDDMVRFNEAIDQAAAESVARYSSMINHSQHLFLAVLGHDLRNPLNTTVMAASFLMRAPGIDSAHAQVAGRIHRSGVRMGRLVDDLIDYTRSHLGASLPMSLSKSNMGLICRSAVEELRLSNPERAIHFTPGADLDGIWDEGRVTQVLSNLIGNALQHGAEREPIHVDVESNGNDVCVRIHNRGPAIDPEAMATIFDPLVRIAGQSAKSPGNDTSLGIGLYIARVIVEAHSGNITVTSDAEHGTTFSVLLPRIAPPVARNRL